MRNASDYYYSQLDKSGRQAYHAIYEGLKEVETGFPVPRLSAKELSDIYFMIRMDHPEIFYTVKFRYRFAQQADHVEFIPEYIFPKAKIIEHRQALESRIKKLVRPAEGMSDTEKELYIHDFICKSIHYDKLKKAYSHEIIGTLGQGVAVCEGIAKSVKILCDRLGVWCIVALAGNNPEKGIKYRHAWNIISIGGVYYHFDATFDNSLGDADDIRYDYVNLSDRQIFRDHEPVIWPIPECVNGEHFYYREKKLSFTKKEDVEKRIRQAAKKSKPFLFHWRGGYLTKEVLEDILKMTDEAAAERGLHAVMSLNWPQAVMKISFTKEKPDNQIELEEANEGELYDENGNQE